jgi:hypothetical protein
VSAVAAEIDASPAAVRAARSALGFARSVGARFALVAAPATGPAMTRIDARVDAARIAQ